MNIGIKNQNLKYSFIRLTFDVFICAFRTMKSRTYTSTSIEQVYRRDGKQGNSSSSFDMQENCDIKNQYQIYRKYQIYEQIDNFNAIR